MSEEKDSKATIRLAVDNAKPVTPRKRKPPAEKDAPHAAEASPGSSFYGPLEQLPDDAPIKALGKKGRVYFFLDSIGQLIELKASEIGRNDIISLFGGNYYLKKHWPLWKNEGGEWVRKNEWRHGELSPILMNACTDRGLWDPADRVRGPGCWAEEDGQLVMHCGDVLYVGKDRVGTGLRGALLYPKSSRLPEPTFGAKPGVEGPGMVLLDTVETWNWARDVVDAKLFVGMIGCCILGAAADWRAQAWITGGPKSGKSTLQLLLRWTLGAGAMIKAENASPAGVSQKLGYCCLPVSLDELEAKANNHQVQEVIELMRIAASGGEKLRGGADGTPMTTQLRSVFMASSVLIPPLKPQDKSRMAILSLNPFSREQISAAAAEDTALDEDAEENAILGSRAKWARIGGLVRGRLVQEWPRYRKTFRAMRRALIRIGHDQRAADQFGAIGAAFDCIMHDGYAEERCEAWGKMLPPSALAETAEQLSEERECLGHLLSAMPDIFRGGGKESVAHWLHKAKGEILADQGRQDKDAAERTLAKIGIRIYRDAASVEMLRARKAVGETVRASDALFWIAISHTHSQLAAIFHGTHWKGEAGSAGTWAQALNRLPDAKFGPKVRRRIDDSLHYVTLLPWETVFLPLGEAEEDDVAPDDRVGGKL